MLLCDGAPEPQRIDAARAVTDDRTIIGNSHDGCRAVGCDDERVAGQLKACLNLHGINDARTRDLPRIGTTEPIVGFLDLISIANALSKNSILVTQSITHRRVLQGRERFDETRGQSSEPAVA